MKERGGELGGREISRKSENRKVREKGRYREVRLSWKHMKWKMMYARNRDKP